MKDETPEDREKRLAHNKKMRDYRAANRDHHLEVRREWTNNNRAKLRQQEKDRRKPGSRTKESRAAYLNGGKERTYAWRAANKDRAAATAKRYNLRHKEENKARAKRYIAKDPERYRLLMCLYSHRRRARMAGAEGSFTPEEILAMYSKQKGKCANPSCRIHISRTGKNKYRIDHIIAISLGGSNYITNVQLLCDYCNGSKWAHDLETWARMNGLLFI